jgi:hypothetical protein
MSIQLFNGHDKDTFHLSLLGIGLYLDVPKFLPSLTYGDVSYGFYLSEEALVASFARKNAFLYYPWTYTHVQTCWHAKLANYGQESWYWITAKGSLEASALCSPVSLVWEREGGDIAVEALIYRQHYRRRFMKLIPGFEKIYYRAQLSFTPELEDISVISTMLPLHIDCTIDPEGAVRTALDALDTCGYFSRS